MYNHKMSHIFGSVDKVSALTHRVYYPFWLISVLFPIVVTTHRDSVRSTVDKVAKYAK